MSSQFLYGRKSDAWQLARFDVIPAANVLEYIENPTVQQPSAAASTEAWSVSFRTNLVSVVSSKYAFDAQFGRFIVGFGAGGENGFFVTAWQNITLFTTGDHTYMLVSDGSNIQAYRDNVAIGGAVSAATNIAAAVWNGAIDSAAFAWPVAIRAGHVANVALDATQRGALHAAMMALA